MRGSVRLCWTGSRIGLTFWRRARNRIGSGGRRKSEIDQPKRRRAKTTSWKWRPVESVENPRAGFPLFPPPLEIRKSSGFPHSPQLRRRRWFLVRQSTHSLTQTTTSQGGPESTAEMGQKKLPNSSEVGTHSQDEIDSMWIIRLLDWVITYDRSGEVGGQSQAVELRPHG